MTGPLAILRELARPLVALAVVLTLMAAVVPGAAHGDGAFCISVGTDHEPATPDGGPSCEACLLVAIPAPVPHTLAERDVVRGTGPLQAARSPVSRAPAAGRIRDPPAV